ncbi:hypothetical protein BLX04_09015 [Bacillus mycoides]|nr:hypothetical protein BLX04_09015 [Bacillus mycoides]
MNLARTKRRKEVKKMEELKSVVMTVTDEELQEAAGAAGCGWLCTVTDDCPNSVFVCC